MNRDALRLLGIAFAMTVVTPAVLYVVTGTLIELLIPCGTDGTLTLATYEGSTLTLSCDFIGILTRTAVATTGTTVVVLGVFLLGIADLFSRT